MLGRREHPEPVALRLEYLYSTFFPEPIAIAIEGQVHTSFIVVSSFLQLWMPTVSWKCMTCCGAGYERARHLSTWSQSCLPGNGFSPNENGTVTQTAPANTVETVRTEIIRKSLVICQSCCLNF